MHFYQESKINQDDLERQHVLRYLKSTTNLGKWIFLYAGYFFFLIICVDQRFWSSLACQKTRSQDIASLGCLGLFGLSLLLVWIPNHPSCSSFEVRMAKILKASNCVLVLVGMLSFICPVF